MSFKILFLEDDKLFGETIEEFLSDEGYEVDWAESGEEALNFCYFKKYDLYLFDVKLPDIGGFELIAQLRDAQDETPLIFLTSKNRSEDLKEGFLKGADDYIKKPVDLEELLLRIKAVLRRTIGEEKIAIGNCLFDMKNMELVCEQEKIELNPKEAQLLLVFLKNRKRIVTKEDIYAALWNRDEIVSDGAVRVYVNTLKKIFGKDAITNIRGVGYRFEK